MGDTLAIFPGRGWREIGQDQILSPLSFLATERLRHSQSSSRIHHESRFELQAMVEGLVVRIHIFTETVLSQFYYGSPLRGMSIEESRPLM